MTHTSPDVAIVGAGIVGAACARALAEDGLRVAVIESGIIAGSATGSGMGHVVVMDDSEAQFALTRYSRDLWAGLVGELPPDCEHEPCGTIWVAADEEEMAVARKKCEYCAARGVRAEVLDASRLYEAEPNLRPGLCGGLLVPDDRVIYPPGVARWLLEQAQDRGAELRLGVRATALTADGVTLDDGSSLSAGAVILACGTATVDLLPGLPVRPRKGHLVITERYARFIRHELVELGYLKSAHAVAADSVAFNVQPRRTGQILIGSSRQYGDELPDIRRGILCRMLHRAIEYMPGLARLAAIRTWTGFRAATPDKLPLIGRWPGHERVWLATGHEGLGIATSLGTARLLADQLAGRATAIPHGPYLPSRIGMRAGDPLVAL
jgi:glycine/D-amino acid oxidase-like deaminating enzyme